MNALWNSAIGLLVVTGGLLGLTLPFGKIATDAGVPAIVWAFVISLGAGGVLLIALLLRGERIRPQRAQAALFHHHRSDFLRPAQPPDVLGHAACRRRLHRHHVHPVACHHTGAFDSPWRTETEPARHHRHRGRLRRRSHGRGNARRGRAARGLDLGGDRAAHPALAGQRQHLPHHRLAKRYRADRACRRQPPRCGSDAACRHSRARRRQFARPTGGIAARRRRADGLGGRDVRLLLPAAGGRRAGLSQPDRLCRSRGRACFPGRCSSASAMRFRPGWVPRSSSPVCSRRRRRNRPRLEAVTCIRYLLHGYT